MSAASHVPIQIEQVPVDADTTVVDQIRSGDTAALQALMADFWQPLCRYANRILSSTDEAQDVVLEVFVRFWERREDWGESGSIKSLLYQMTHNLCIDEHRRRRSRLRLTVAPVPASFTSYGRSPFEGAVRNELEAAYVRAVDQLPERRRQVFMLSRNEGLSTKEIGAVLGITQRTVLNLISLALRDLRRILQPFIVTDPAD